MSSVQPSAGSPIRLSTGRKTVFTAALMLLLVFLAESGLRVRAWMRYGSSTTDLTGDMMVSDPMSGLRVPRPGYHVKGAKIDIAINSLGFRGDEITVEKPRRTVRVACVGASTTFCGEVSHNHATWPHQLQERLQAAYPDVTIQIINAGVPGYTSKQSVVNLRERVLPIHPDLVIFYEANNEIVRDTRQVAIQRGIAQPAQSGQYQTLASLSRHSLLFDLLMKNVGMLVMRAPAVVGKLNGVPTDLPKGFIGEIERMRQELQRGDIDLVLSTFLVKYRRSQPRDQQIANADVAFYYMPWMTIDDLLDAMDLYNNAIVSYGRAHGVPVIEDREAIPADAEHYADCMHLTDAGAARMAVRVAGFLQTSGVLERLVDRARTGGR